MIRELRPTLLGHHEQYDEKVDAYIEAKQRYVEEGKEPAPAFILKHLPNSAGKVLAEIGCGTGDEAAVYEQMGFAGVQGVDPSEKMLERARRNIAHPWNFRLGTCTHTGFDNQSVDVAVAQYSLHYEENLDEAYLEFARILRPGGTLVLAVRHPAWDAAEPNKFQKHGREYVRTFVYEKIPVENPVHTIAEYLSPLFHEYFELIETKEGDSLEIDGKMTPPIFFGNCSETTRLI